MFHRRLWKVLSEVAAAHCNARVYMLNVMLDRNKRTSEQGDPKPRPGNEEDKS